MTPDYDGLRAYIETTSRTLASGGYGSGLTLMVLTEIREYLGMPPYRKPLTLPEKLAVIGTLRPGMPMPPWLDPADGWGPAISKLCAEAALALGAELPTPPEPEHPRESFGRGESAASTAPLRYEMRYRGGNLPWIECGEHFYKHIRSGDDNGFDVREVPAG